MSKMCRILTVVLLMVLWVAPAAHAAESFSEEWQLPVHQVVYPVGTPPVPPASFRFTVTRRAIKIIGSGAAVGRHVTIFIKACRPKCLLKPSGAGARRTQIRLKSTAIEVRMPHIARGRKVQIGFSMRAFSVTVATSITYTYEAFNFDGTIFPPGGPASHTSRA
jgi:hypothetical protein